jgi:CRP/FNR family transcriptional regulator
MFIATDARAHYAPPMQAPAPAAPAAIDTTLLQLHVALRRVKVEAGDVLYRAGQPLHALYFIHAGFFKIRLVSADGRERTTGFRMRGDLLGIDAIGGETHVSDAVALDAGEVWELSYPEVLDACEHLPQLQSIVTRALAAEVRADRSWMLALGTLDAEQRVAAFLLDLGARHAALGYSEQRFVLRMTRAEIGSFLSLQLETVTRALTRLQQRGLVDVERREIRIVDGAALAALAGA